VAKKRSKNNGPTRKPNKTAPTHGGLMALNKSHTSLGMKIIIIALIVAFVSLFLYGGVASIIDLFKSKPATAGVTTDPVKTIGAKYEPQVTALTAMVASEPASYTVLVSLGNAYFDWAQELSKASQTSTPALAATPPLWLQAKDAYGRAVKAKPGEAAVTIDYAIATFYSGETTAAIAIAEPIAQSQPKFAQAWLNLGVFYSAANQNAKAIEAFDKYLVLDPKGTQGNLDYVKQQLDTLKKGTATTP